MADQRYDLEELDKFPGVWILDSNFNKIDMIDDYISLIWANRYIEVGDFELYCEASDRNMGLLKHGNYVSREDYPEEVCRIEKIEIKTDPEEGNFITATGRDLRCILYQRCRQFKYTYSNSETAQNIEMLIRTLVDENFINTSPYKEQTRPNVPWYQIYNHQDSNAKYNNPDRAIPNMKLGPVAGINAELYTITLEPSIIGEIIADWAEQFLFGWRVRLERSNTTPVTSEIIFECYEGEDRTNQVVFAEKFNNLRDTTYEVDYEKYANAVISVNDIEKSIVMGNATGIDRYEAVIDEKDESSGNSVPSSLTWENLVDMFGWSWERQDNNEYGLLDYEFVYMNDPLFQYQLLCFLNLYFTRYDFPLYGYSSFEDDIKAAYPSGTEITKDGMKYWRVTKNITCSFSSDGISFKTGWKWDGELANFTDFAISVDSEILDGTLNLPYSGKPSYEGSSDWIPGLVVYLPTYVKNAMLQDLACAKALQYARTTKFSGNLETFGQYRFRKDYGIGDKVRVVTDTGVDEDVRITEAVETFDSDGYNIEVGFEKE